MAHNIKKIIFGSNGIFKISFWDLLTFISNAFSNPRGEQTLITCISPFLFSFLNPSHFRKTHYGQFILDHTILQYLKPEWDDKISEGKFLCISAPHNFSDYLKKALILNPWPLPCRSWFLVLPEIARNVCWW